MRTAFAPKLASAVAIAHAMFGMPERASVLFSSTASLFGAPGQGNYAAANAALEGFASSRSASGLVTSAIQWGAWAAGMASASSVIDLDLPVLFASALMPLVFRDNPCV